MNGINFSPQIWWNAMDRAVEFANHMGKDLIQDFNGSIPKLGEKDKN